MRATLVAFAALLALAASTLPTAPAASSGQPSSGQPATDPATADSRAVGRPARIDGWPTTTPKQAGFWPQRLRRVAAEAKAAQSNCLAVVRDGRLVADWNWGTPRTEGRQVFSVTKSVASALVGIAVRDGDLDIDDPVADYVPSWRGTASADVTVRDLLSNTSGRYWSEGTDYLDLAFAENRTQFSVDLGQQYPRGTTWIYNNAAIQVLDRVLRNATGRRTDVFARDRLFRPLGMRHSYLTGDQSGRSTNLYFGLHTTCLDLARFARLHLQNGAVGGKRILGKAWVREAVGRSSSEFNAAYGHLWWLNRYGPLRGYLDPIGEDGQPLETRVGQLAPAAAETLYAAIGLGDQIAMVDPGSRTIVVRLGAAESEDFGLPRAARVVTWASKR